MTERERVDEACRVLRSEEFDLSHATHLFLDGLEAAFDMNYCGLSDRVARGCALVQCGQLNGYATVLDESDRERAMVRVSLKENDIEPLEQVEMRIPIFRVGDDVPYRQQNGIFADRIAEQTRKKFPASLPVLYHLQEALIAWLGGRTPALHLAKAVAFAHVTKSEVDPRVQAYYDQLGGPIHRRFDSTNVEVSEGTTIVTVEFQGTAHPVEVGISLERDW